MAILDNLLGGGDSSQQSTDWSQQDVQFATNPNSHVDAQDVLHSMSNDEGDSSEFTGIGDIGVDVGAPTFVGVSNASSSEQASNQDDNNGGLLGGLI